MNEKTKPSYYAIIPASVRYDKSVCANAKLLYGELTALANQLGYCYSSNEYFRDLYQVKRIATISGWIAQLKNAGYIKVEYAGKYERKIYITSGVQYVSKKQRLAEKRNEPYGKTQVNLRKNVSEPYGKTQHNNKENNKPNNIGNNPLINQVKSINDKYGLEYDPNIKEEINSFNRLMIEKSKTNDEILNRYERFLKYKVMNSKLELPNTFFASIPSTIEDFEKNYKRISSLLEMSGGHNTQNEKKPSQNQSGEEIDIRQQALNSQIFKDYQKSFRKDIGLDKI